MHTVSKTARHEIVAALRTRYGRASKAEKRLILGEFTAISGYHRKHAIRLLNAVMDSAMPQKVPPESRRVYDAAVKAALILIWEAADRICGKRLKVAIPTLIGAMEKHGHLKLDPDVRKRVLAVSAATIDRMLAPVRKAMNSQMRGGNWSQPGAGWRHSRALGRDCVVRLDGDLHVAGLDITLREIRVRIQRKGFRSLELRLWTTLLDPKEAPVQELAQLYAKRWEHELFCRELKHCLRRNDVLQSHPIRVELCQLCAWL